MKNYIITTGLVMVIGLFTACEDFIDLYPESYVTVENYYQNYDDINTALMGCVGGMRAPLNFEWMLTDVRSDNAKQGSTGSSSAPNLELNDLDMYTLSSEHPRVYDYWYSVYKNIYSVNLVLNALGVDYDSIAGETKFHDITITIDSVKRENATGEALFIRAYHYFNLVRLFGGVFIVTEPVTPPDAKKINRSSVEAMYRLIVSDLKLSSSLLENLEYDATSSELGLPNDAASKSLLAKVYLTIGNKTDALSLLTNVIINSGHSLLPNYSDVFSINNEMNPEIIFAIRYKAGGLGMGSPFANWFAAANSGSFIINGDGSGYNYPTTDLNTLMTTADLRYPTTMATYAAKSSLYVTKFLSQVTIKGDAENDFPVIRYSDVLLMMAEAQGYPSGIYYLNQTRNRAGIGNVPATVVDQATFEAELLKERQMEFAFENHRFFDLLRFNVLVPTIRNHFANEYISHYSKYKPTQSLQYYQSKVTVEKQLLPIPQREIDTNNDIDIEQNPGY